MTGHTAATVELGTQGARTNQEEDQGMEDRGSVPPLLGLGLIGQSVSIGLLVPIELGVGKWWIGLARVVWVTGSW